MQYVVHIIYVDNYGIPKEFVSADFDALYIKYVSMFCMIVCLFEAGTQACNWI